MNFSARHNMQKKFTRSDADVYCVGTQHIDRQSICYWVSTEQKPAARAECFYLSVFSERGFTKLVYNTVNTAVFFLYRYTALPYFIA